MNDKTMNKLSYVNGVSDKPLIFKTIGNLLNEAVSNHADKSAIVVRHQDVRLSYAELNDLVNRVAGNLFSQGIETGDRVGGLKSYASFRQTSRDQIDVPKPGSDARASQLDDEADRVGADSARDIVRAEAAQSTSFGR